jgi:small-conductance mechanosensitive channel
MVSIDSGETELRAEDRARSGASAERRLADLQARVRAQQRRIQSLEARLTTRVKREEIILNAIGLAPGKVRPGETGHIGELQRILLKNEELLLSSNKRVESILTALKNHREVLIKLNKRVYKEGARDQMKLELAVMGNTLSLLGMGGFEFDSSIPEEIRRIRAMLEKEDAELSKVRKRKETLDKKFESELQKFDVETVYKKKKDIPGYL